MSTQDAECLRARLDEDEAAARRVASLPPWSVSEQNDDGTYDVEPAEAPDGLWHGEVASHIAGYDAEHIARHDPARVFADIAAKRQILALYEEFAAELDRQRVERSAGGLMVGGAVHGATQALADVVAALAAVYTGAEEAVT